MGRVMRALVGGAAVAVAALAATAVPSDAHGVVAGAHLIDGTGVRVGEVRFTPEGHGDLRGRVRVQLPADSPEFHGMHIHANADGTGCVAGTGFTGVGGHWDTGGHTHGTHTGDLPSVHRMTDGSAEIIFFVDKFVAADLVGRALIIHAGPDNFGNVPLGAAANQYTDNGSAYNGPGGTAATGNAGARYACGVIEARG